MSVNEREEECIRVAHEYKVRDHIRRLQLEMERVGVSFDPSIQVPPPTIGQRVLQVLLSPLLLIVWFAGIFERRALRRKIDREIASLKNAPANGKVTEIKTITELWRFNGLPDGRSMLGGFGLAERTECAGRWLEVLYGPGASERVRFRTRVANLLSTYEARSRAAATVPSDPNVKLYIHPPDPIYNLFQEIEQDLPQYDEIA